MGHNVKKMERVLKFNSIILDIIIKMVNFIIIKKSNNPSLSNLFYRNELFTFRIIKKLNNPFHQVFMI